MSKLVYQNLSYKVLETAFAVHSALGPGLLEAVYDGAYCVEISHMGIPFTRQQVFPVVYRGEYVGAYFADIVVDNTIIVVIYSIIC